MKIATVERWALPETDQERFDRAYLTRRDDIGNAIDEFEILANEGSLLSLLALGNIYFDGKYTAKNLALAERYYRRAADAGSLIGRFYLGHVYLRMRNNDAALSSFSYLSTK